MFIMAVVFEQYLEKQYLTFLINETYTSDKYVLSAEKEYLQFSIKHLVDSGSKISLDTGLINDANAYAADPDALDLRLALAQDVRLIVAQYAEDIEAVAIVKNTGKILYQVERAFGASGINLFWNNENRTYLDDMHTNLKQIISASTLPKYALSVQPNNLSVVSHDVEITHTDRLVHMAFALPGSTNKLTSENAFVVVSFKLGCVDDFLEQMEQNPKGYSKAYITDSNQMILYSDRIEDTGKKFNPEISGKVMVLTDTISRPQWNLNIVIDRNKMETYVHSSYLKGMFFFLMALLLIVFLQILFIRRALRPVHEITKGMERVQKGNLDNRIRIDGENEIWQLAMRYNNMADSLSQQKQETEREYQGKMISVKRAGEAEMDALQSQINAHFLCNTLNAINYSAIEAGDEEVSDMLKKLSNIMQYVFSRNYRFVTLGDEINWLEQYLSLQKFRQMDSFDYRINFPEIYRDWPCCKLFLQPFVENSIKHGFAEKDSRCLIDVCGCSEGNRLVLTIEDNGCGMTLEQNAKVRELISEKAAINLKGTGIGLENVTARMRLYYGSGFEIDFRTQTGSGTIFILKLPIPEILKGENEKDENSDS